MRFPIAAILLAGAVFTTPACVVVPAEDAGADAARDSGREPLSDVGLDFGIDAPFVASYVRLHQLSFEEGGARSGADIDAVGVIKGDTTHWATRVAFHDGAINPEGALGAPSPPVGCETADYASMGERLNSMIFAFGPPIDSEGLESGDTIVVHEVTTDQCDESGTDIIEVDIYIGAGIDGPFEIIAACGPGECSRTIP